jgi:hypothetical protein
MNTPVLFLVFNRPGPTRRVMDAIRQARPPRLYIAADGPRTNKEGEAALTAEVREIATSVDWPCEVHTLFRDRNLGCRTAVSSGIDWFFDHEEEGIILEDDCLPAESFFRFCEEMLSRYRHDERIWQISGTVFFPDAVTNKQADYFFSRFGPVWGWATWRRAWRGHYDVDLLDWEKMKSHENFSLAYPSRHEALAKLKIGQALYENRINTWDYQWGIIKAFNSGLTVLPRHNMVLNLGFDQDATHTSERPWDAPTHAFDFDRSLIHPQFLLRDWRHDDHYVASKFKQRKTLRSIIRNAAKNLLRLLGQS